MSVVAVFAMSLSMEIFEFILTYVKVNHWHAYTPGYNTNLLVLRTGHQIYWINSWFGFWSIYWMYLITDNWTIISPLQSQKRI